MDQVELAKRVATKAHEGQTRKFGEDKGKPYIIHPERVAKKFDRFPILQTVAWLHDVIEDTNITISELKNMGFTSEVILGVIAITHTSEISYLDYILRIKNVDYARPVKIADIEDNMNFLHKGSLRDKYMLALYILKS